MTIRSALKRLGVLVLVLLVAIQFFGPKRTNPSVDASKTLQAATAVPADVTAILARSCDDCHTNNTAWPWYTYVAPVSWFIIRHVDSGRRHLNFSKWGEYAPKRQLDKLGEVVELVNEGEMPLTSYTLLHASAKLDPAAKARLAEWASAERGRLSGAQPESRK